MFHRTAEPYKASRHRLRTALFVLAGFSIGFVSASLRPYAVIGAIHIEAMIEFFFVIPLLCLFILISFLRTPIGQALPAMAGQYTAFYFMNMVGRFFGAPKGSMADEFIGMAVIYWVCTVVITSLVLWAVEWIWPLKVASIDCPACGYSLKGIGLSGACPECGRPFTVEALGVSADELRV
jgi:hypothetical protein